jgi:hypothetical protein
MLFFDGGLALLALGLWLFCIIDVITTPEGEARNLPKIVWLFVVILLSDIGSLAWLIAGRDWSGSGRRDAVGYRSDRRSAPGARSSFPSYDRPGRYVPSNPDDDEAFLAQLKARADEQRRRAREAQRPAEDEPPAPAAE